MQSCLTAYIGLAEIDRIAVAVEHDVVARDRCRVICRNAGVAAERDRDLIGPFYLVDRRERVGKADVRGNLARRIRHRDDCGRDQGNAISTISIIDRQIILFITGNIQTSVMIQRINRSVMTQYGNGEGYTGKFNTVSQHDIL